jgi:hypothetical protein
VISRDIIQAQIVNAVAQSLTLIVVLLTLVYVLTTREQLDEMKKQRELSFQPLMSVDFDEANIEVSENSKELWALLSFKGNTENIGNSVSISSYLLVRLLLPNKKEVFRNAYYFSNIKMGADKKLSFSFSSDIHLLKLISDSNSPFMLSIEMYYRNVSNSYFKTIKQFILKYQDSKEELESSYKYLRKNIPVIKDEKNRLHNLKSEYPLEILATNKDAWLQISTSEAKIKDLNLELNKAKTKFSFILDCIHDELEYNTSSISKKEYNEFVDSIKDIVKRNIRVNW